MMPADLWGNPEAWKESLLAGRFAAPTSAGVSAATTSTVVVASVSILIFDYFVTALWGV
jgi:ABC-type transporter Mla maintaining outer membrane lipid asymmetry permease subunit MlaE